MTKAHLFETKAVSRTGVGLIHSASVCGLKWTPVKYVKFPRLVTCRQCLRVMERWTRNNPDSRQPKKSSLMNWTDALAKLKQSLRVKRRCWRKDTWLEVVEVSKRRFRIYQFRNNTSSELVVSDKLRKAVDWLECREERQVAKSIN